MRPRTVLRRGPLSMAASFALLSVLSGCASDYESEATLEPSPTQPTGTPGTRRFEITIENVSGDSALSTGFSPGVYATHGGSFSLFAEGAADRDQGLARIAEDGNPTMLGMALAKDDALVSKGVFDIPTGDTAKGPATPGKRYVFTVEANASASSLSFATMYGQSNDWFLAPAASGIPLLDTAGNALPERDVTDLVYVWDVGSEVNQAPGLGPDQGPRQKGPDMGPTEGVIAPFTDATRAYPSALKIASVDVASGDDGAFVVTVKNVSGPGSSIVTGISPIFYAVHDASWSLFEDGAPASMGLERLAEDGNAGALAEEHMGASGTSMVGAAAIPNGASAPGGAPPGGSFTFSVKPDAAHRFLSIASMVGESNDAFLGFGKEGVALIDEAGNPRPPSQIADDFARLLVVWDAGTEANEVPGAGKNQGPRQGTPNTGPADPQKGVRRYSDATNDLLTGAGGVVSVAVQPGADASHLTVVVTNTSAATAYPGRASPLVWAAHTGHHVFFTAGKAASPAIEHLAEDGNGVEWNDSFEGLEDVAAHGIVSRPTGMVADGPINPGNSYTFSIPVGGNARYFDFAQMWTPSNDTFISLGAKGVALVDDAGAVRPLAAINEDIRGLLSAWDAGTEANQAGALGPDQAPRQAAQNTGAGEGGGLVRRVDGTWGVPVAKHLVRVRIKPL